MQISEATFKDKPILVFKRSDDDKFPVSFGVRKAQIILEHIDVIQNFFEKHKDTLNRTTDRKQAYNASEY